MLAQGSLVDVHPVCAMQDDAQTLAHLVKVRVGLSLGSYLGCG